MRIPTIFAFAASAALLLASQAFAQAPNLLRAAAVDSSEVQSVIRVTNVTVVHVEELSSSDQAIVFAVVSNASSDDMQKLQDAVEASQQASAVLQERGVQPSQVVAAGIADNGALTLIAARET
ncbi:MAG TPA: hypothetical protein VKS78_01840 [Roseiarcus sp.]|nr:hypothetical protein [Roseiarcus sp.]